MKGVLIDASASLCSEDVNVQNEGTNGRDTGTDRVRLVPSGRLGIRWRNLRAKEREGKEGLVVSADHHAIIFFPGLDVTMVRQCASHEPGQKEPAEAPEQSEERVDGEVHTRIEPNEAVEYDRKA